MAKAKKHGEENLEKASEETNEATEQTNQTGETNTQEELSKEVESLKDRLLRLQADFMNYKARTEKEKVSTYSNAVSDLALDLLPVVDNLERSLEAENFEGSSFKEGVEMVYNQFMGILEKKGLKEIEALHKPFDHNFHFGVAFEASEEFDDGIVIEVLQKGYTVNDKCIRPSMVKICRK